MKKWEDDEKANIDGEVKWPSNKKYRKYPCKKLKGEHDFELDATLIPSRHFICGKVEPLFFGPVYYYRCSGCGKKYRSDKPLGVKKKTDDYKES